MRPVHDEMARDGAIRIEHRDFGDGIVEQRTIAHDHPNPSFFTAEDMGFVDASIAHYWEMTGMESSDESHGIAWHTRANGDQMPYECALLSDRKPSDAQYKRMQALVSRRELTTL